MSLIENRFSVFLIIKFLILFLKEFSGILVPIFRLARVTSMQMF